MRDRILIRHFLARLFDNDLISPQADAHKGASIALGCLLSAGAFLTVISGSKYVMTPLRMPAWNAAGYVDDSLLFVLLSMLVLALVAVVAWDGLALDARDEAILGPLPISRARMVRAKLAAMGVLAGAVLLALNGPPTILHPSAVLAQLPAGFAIAGRLMAAHAVTTAAAGLFGFCAVLAVRELLRAALGGWWPAASTRLQATLIVLLATTFLVTPSFLGKVPERLTPPASSDWRVRANPAMWFVGLHELLVGTAIVDIPSPPAMPRRLQAVEDRARARHRASRSGVAGLAATAVAALALSGGLAFGAFLWNARRPAARARTPRRGDARRASLGARIVAATLARSPAVRAGFFFTVRVVTRSVPHRAALAVAAAFGLAVAAIGIGRAMRTPADPAMPTGLLAIQTLLIACVLAGGEQAMRLPAHLPAAWSVQLAWPGDTRGYLTGVKRALAAVVGLPVIALLLAVHVAFLAPGIAVGHAAVGAMLLLIGIELRFLAVPALPFLTAYAAGNRLKLAPLWFGAAIVVAEAIARIEASALGGAGATAGLLAVLLACWRALAWVGHRRAAPREDDLDLFQAPLDEATQLKL
jgi:hypothetical protein